MALFEGENTRVIDKFNGENFNLEINLEKATMKSSTNIFMNWSKYFLKALLIALWNVGGPYGITIQTKAPQSIAKVSIYLQGL